MSVPLSILDLAPVAANSSAAAAIRNTVELAQLGERLGYIRHWFAEHHGMPSVASSAPEILIGHVAAATTKLRVGAGGIMLPNHAPLRVAEIFRSLEALHPGRIDLGLGRAPGSDVKASRALRAQDGERFPALLAELLAFTGQAEFDPGHPYAGVQAMPADVPLPPIWILGSSGASARMAGSLGMGYSFAGHFSNTPAAPAFAEYRAHFQPSAQFPTPHAILGVAAVCAPSDAEAARLASTMELAWVRIARGQFLPLPSPEEALAYPYDAREQALVEDYRRRTLVGHPDRVAAGIKTLAHDNGADEIMVVSNLYGQAERLRSYELLMRALRPA